MVKLQELKLISEAAVLKDKFVVIFTLHILEAFCVLKELSFHRSVSVFFHLHRILLFLQMLVKILIQFQPS